MKLGNGISIVLPEALITVSTLAPVAGMSIWLKASSLGLADNDPVATWSDLSGNGNHATQGMSGKRPLFKSNVLNGLGVVRFDGTDDALSFSALTLRSVFAVVKKASVSGHSAVLSSSSDGGQYVSGPEEGSGSGACICDSGSGQQATSGVGLYNTWMVISGVTDDAVSGPRTLYRDGVAGTSVASPDAWVFDQLGTYSFGSGSILNGDIAEIIGYSTALSDPDREANEMYLAARYAL